MRHRILVSLLVAATVVTTGLASLPRKASGGDLPWFHSGPPTLTDVARMIDCIQEKLVNQGTVVVKQPDIWSEARMTMFRKEFEDTMKPELTTFEPTLAARLARSDVAQLASQTAVGAVLTPFGPRDGNASNPNFTPQITSQAQLNSTQAALFGTTAPADTNAGVVQLPNVPTIAPPNGAGFSLLTQVAKTDANGKVSPFSGLDIGLEPNVKLDQKADFIGHLHRIRRVNLGDDTADSAGYGLYLMRVPVSLQPGDRTKKGFGAIVNLTMRHDFGPRFLPATYRNLVINDLVDQLAPIVHESIRNGNAFRYAHPEATVTAQKLRKLADNAVTEVPKATGPRPSPGPGGDRTDAQPKTGGAPPAGAAPPATGPGTNPPLPPPPQGTSAAQADRYRKYAREFDSPRPRRAPFRNTIDPQDLSVVSSLAVSARQDSSAKELAKRVTSNRVKPVSLAPVSRTGPRSYAIAPTDVPRVYLRENILRLAASGLTALGLEDTASDSDVSLDPPDTAKVKHSEVRSFLRHELEAAYDLMEGRSRDVPSVLQDTDYIDDLTNQFYSRKYEGPKGLTANGEEEHNEFETLYESLCSRMPGNMKDRPMGALCWAIALEAGLLNRQLHEDMKQTKGANDFVCPPEVDEMPFFAPLPIPELETTFQQYVLARWPMITFALDPVVDEQNIEDSLTRRRDLQIAVAFAFSAGRISFRQLLQYNRQLQYEAQTIALNRTISAFANGNDTFGWRIAPRFQTPPEESNPRALANLLLNGGPGPNWTKDNSWIEPGIRELTSVVIMPSFVRGLRVDVNGDWYRLHDPDERKIHTAKTLEIGRLINEARDSLDQACKCGKYRPEDTDRLRAKLRQLESMLPMQTQFVKVPYENTLGGFALFTQGATSLVPELSGFEGIEYINPKEAADIVVYGKHFSLYEMAVVVGGKALPREGTNIVLAKTDTAPPKAVTVTNTLSALRGTDGKLIAYTSDGTAVPIQDQGSYDVQSREVMRVRIPADVKTSHLADGTEVVEISVSTPTGISNTLRIPVAPTTPQPAPPTVSSTVTPGFVLANPTLTIRVNARLDPQGSLIFAGPKLFPDDATLSILPVGQMPPADSYSVRLTFPYSSTTVLEPIQVDGLTADAATGAIVLRAADLNGLATRIIGRIRNSGLAITPNAVIVSRGIVLQPVSGDASNLPAYTTSNQLGVVFEFVIQETPPATTSSSGSGNGATPAVAAPRVAGILPSAPASTPTLLATGEVVPAGYTRGLVPATQVSDGVAAEQGDDARPTSRRPDHSARRATAGPEDLGRPRLLLDDEERRTPVRTQAETPAAPAAPSPPIVIPPPIPAEIAAPANRPVATPDQAGRTIPNLVHSAQSLVVVPPAPSVNVSVPVTNNSGHHRLGDLFHRRKEPATPQNPTRPPLLERLRGGN